MRIPRGARLTRDRKTDVLIVGAGISGALMAYQCARQGHQVTIIDRRGVARGSTAASTALLQFEIDTPLVHLARRMGMRAAGRAWQRSKAAVASLAAGIRRERIQASVSNRSSLYLAGHSLNAAGLAREARARRRFGLPSRYINRAEIATRYGISRSAAILSGGSLVADPRALTAGFLRRAMSGGAQLFAPHEVIDVHPGRSGVIALVKGGREIQCKHLVFCTGYELPKIIPQTAHRIVSTWAMATAPQPERLWSGETLIWEASDPYLYVRATSDGRVICGGEDSADTSQRADRLAAKTAVLETKLGILLPGLNAHADFAWTGCFGQSDSGLPTIGSIPRHSRCHAALGFGGNGITFSMLASEIIASSISGRRDPDARLFAFE